MALLEAIDSVIVSLNSLEIKGDANLRSLGTSGRERYLASRKEYKRRLAQYRKMLRQLGGKVKGDQVSYQALRDATQ